jgi:hypothetical protein
MATVMGKRKVRYVPTDAGGDVIGRDSVGNEFPAPCNHTNFLGKFVQADGWARLPVTPLNLVQVSCGELF